MPWSFNISSFVNISEQRKQVNDILREELLPGLQLDIPDFIYTVLGYILRLDKLAKEVFDIY